MFQNLLARVLTQLHILRIKSYPQLRSYRNFCHRVREGLITYLHTCRRGAAMSWPRKTYRVRGVLQRHARENAGKDAMNKGTRLLNVMFTGAQLILPLDAQPLRNSLSSSSSSGSEIAIT
jgi:hypothetical protein